MWSTILLLLAGFAIGVVFILLALIAILFFVAVVLDDELKVALTSPASGPAAPLPPWPLASQSYPRYPGQPPHTTHRDCHS